MRSDWAAINDPEGERLQCVGAVGYPASYQTGVPDLPSNGAFWGVHPAFELTLNAWNDRLANPPLVVSRWAYQDDVVYSLPTVFDGSGVVPANLDAIVLAKEAAWAQLNLTANALAELGELENEALLDLVTWQYHESVSATAGVEIQTVPAEQLLVRWIRLAVCIDQVARRLISLRGLVRFFSELQTAFLHHLSWRTAALTTFLAQLSWFRNHGCHPPHTLPELTISAPGMRQMHI